MGRYDIAKAAFKSPEELFKQPKKSSLKAFGFENAPTFGKEYLKRAKTYYCPPGTIQRVGIVFKDSAHLFMGGKVHFHESSRTQFLCKRESGGQPSLCCTLTRPPVARIACVIIAYNNQNEYIVIPWVFGRRVYEELNRLNSITPLQYDDFMLERNTDRDIFNPWKIYPAQGMPFGAGDSSLSIWQANYKEDVLRLAEPHFMNLKSCIGRDLNEDQIRDLINRPDVSPPTNRARPPLQPPVTRPRRRRSNLDIISENLSRMTESSVQRLQQTQQPNSNDFSDDFFAQIRDL